MQKNENFKFPSIQFGDVPEGATSFFQSYLNGSLLDLGCGGGSIGKKYKNSVYGVEMDWLSLRRARTHEIVIRYKIGKEHLPFADNSFDSAIAKDIIEHLEEPWYLIYELRRVIKPGAIVVATSPMAKPSVVWNDYTHIRGFTKSAFRNLFLHCGFEVLDIFPSGMYRISSKLGFSRFLPLILKFPFIEMVTGSWFLLARNPNSPNE